MSVFEKNFVFDEPGYISELVTVNDTYVINSTSAISISRTVHSGVNFTMVILMNESEEVYADYHQYENKSSSAYIMENFDYNPTHDYEIGPLFYDGNSSELATADPDKVMMILYYQGTGTGNITIHIDFSNLSIILDTSVDFLFYPGIFAIPVLYIFRKNRNKPYK